MGFTALHPTPALSPLIESIWDCDLPAQPHRLERIMPVAKAGLIINLAEDETRTYDPDTLQCRRHSAFTLDGPSDRCGVIDTTEQAAVMGVIFHPGAASAFFRERFDRLLNGCIDMDGIFGLEAGRLREQLLEAGDAASRLLTLQAWLLARAQRAAPRAGVLAHAIALLDRTPQVQRIDRVARDCGLSPRRLSALFNEHVGLAPKRYARLQRFHRVVGLAHRRQRIDWADVAADCGFHDQPHLVREFRAFSGLTPTAYLSRKGPWRNHLPLE
jgi:AraC-like DNA-binding protein